ncbi:MAG: hypothetical protein ABF295_07370 [Flavobacteriaceae bacterium]
MADQTHIQKKTDQFPFRKIARASFLRGGLSLVFGIVFLLLVKPDLDDKNYIGLGIKLIAAVSFLTIGVRSIWKGYLKEYNFSLKDIFDVARDIKVNYLLAQRASDHYGLAQEYMKIFDSKNLSYTKSEKGNVNSWQFIFFKLVSKRGFSEIFDYVPFQITNFINNQSKPVSLFGFLVVGLLALAFIGYLDIIQFNLFWINLGILLVLLALWQPSKIDYLTHQKSKNAIGRKLLLFTALYVVIVVFYNPSGSSMNLALLSIILLLFVVIAYTAWISFKIAEDVFTERKRIGVQISDIDLKTIRVATQPSNVKQQFENILKKHTGWYFAYDYDKENKSGEVRGEQKHKGDFNFQNVFESNPSIISTAYDEGTEKKLSRVYKLGLVLLAAGLSMIFIGILIFPTIDANNFDQMSTAQIEDGAFNFFTSLFFSLIGIALLSFGNRLVYEIYMFFNSEIFFESNLILFRANGSYDEFEHISGGIKRKDTFADFTPDIETCYVRSSIFVHPYLDSSRIQSLPRYVIQVAKNDALLGFLVDEYKKNLRPYLMKLDSGFEQPRIDEPGVDGYIEGADS